MTMNIEVGPLKNPTGCWCDGVLGFAVTSSCHSGPHGIRNPPIEKSGDQQTTDFTDFTDGNSASVPSCHPWSNSAIQERQSQSKPVKVFFNLFRQGQAHAGPAIYCGFHATMHNQWWFAPAADATVGRQSAIRNPRWKRRTADGLGWIRMGSTARYPRSSAFIRGSLLHGYGSVSGGHRPPLQVVALFGDTTKFHLFPPSST
jgi:hypothetical protein